MEENTISRKLRTDFAVPEDSDDSDLDDSDADPDYLPSTSGQQRQALRSTSGNVLSDNSDSSDVSSDESTPVGATTAKIAQSSLHWEKVSQENSEKQSPSCNLREVYSEVESPVYYFRMFFDEDVLDNIMEQSNLFSVQKNPNRPLNVDTNEIEVFMGSCIFMSVFGLPRSRMFWANNTRVETVANVMPRDRWEFIKSCVHFNDNTKLPSRNDPNCDRLFKVRPLVDEMQKKFKNLPLRQMLCVDEQIIPYKGKSALKQYNPKKPHKWGYKEFILSDSNGLVHNLEMYTGSIAPVEGIPDIGPSGNIVLRLLENVPRHEGYLLYCDNWFSSLKLFSVLAEIGIGVLGTIRVNRFPGLQFQTDKEMKKEGEEYLTKLPQK
ncbi:piggyBac transposable element-derived protein 2-like [Bacillus rossius redtenbacheri]|uniref:piggyBac transposable element-derived protein 2-like n=1 Tax=Bacillus rossius redtenbacheri TaxID=93214 RepID=UPI002FDEE9D2